MSEHGAPKSARPGAGPAKETRRLGRAILTARAAIWWEAAWPRLQGVLILLVFYVGLSWLGLWALLPRWLAILCLLVFAALLLRAVYRLRFVRWPSRVEAVHRVELDTGLRHRPLSALDDRLFGQGDGAETGVLWAAHQARMAEALKNLRAAVPHPEAFRADPLALRVLAVLLMIVGFHVAGDERWRRLSPFVADEAAEAAPALRIDAWITPPVHTRRAPVFLTGASARLREPGQPVSVPEGSEVTVRAQGIEGLSVLLTGGDEPQVLAAFDSAPGGGAGPGNHRGVLERSGDLQIRDGERLIDAWPIVVEPDAAPTVRLLDDPEEQFSGSVRFSYLLGDDYGIVEAWADVSPVRSNRRDGGAPARPLVEAPHFPLSLPGGESGRGAGETIRDLTSHPWAGSPVSLVLGARDHAGQEGRSTPHDFTLPQRRFAKPLARAIVEQRRDLALDANAQVRVLDAFDGLLLAPDQFIERPRTYLGMRFVRQRIAEAQTDDALRETVDLMWELALSIEDGNLSLAEQALRDAQEALRKALEEGASDEEIARLTDELRKALDTYLQALAEQMRQNPQAMQPMDPNMRSMRPQDLEDMLSRIEELARTGSRDAARELLAEMQRMLENLQTGRPQQMPGGMSQEMMEALNELGQMIQRQQELMDQTHRFDQGNPDGDPQQGQRGRDGEQGQMTPEQMAEALRRLQQGQGDLSDRLQQLLDQMGENGIPQNGELGRAGEEMGKARDSLGEGDSGSALGQQGNALDALRRGAQGLAEQMFGQGQSGPGMARQSGPRDEDPLGRPRRSEGPDFGGQVRVPDEIDVQRARRILEELRRRFSDPGRPTLELDYLERLLRRY